MPIKRATGNVTFAIQPISSSAVVQQVGILPTTAEVRPSVPEVISQGDSYFCRDSIGSANFDSRMDFPLQKGTQVQLKKSEGLLAKSLSLSVERPVLLANVDLLKSNNSSFSLTEMAIGENLEISNFETTLLFEDYKYVMDLLESGSTSKDYSALKDSATSNFSKTDTSVNAITKLSAGGENFSRNLDIRLSWDSLKEKIAEYYSTFSPRFGTSAADSSFSNLGIDIRTDTGTAIVEKLKSFATLEQINSARTSSSYEQLVKRGPDFSEQFINEAFDSVLKRVSTEDMLFDNGQIESYSSLPKLEKVAICCELLSRVVGNTFNSITGSIIIDMPTIYSGCNVFEPFDVVSNNVVTSSHYALINDSFSSLSTSKISSFKNEFVSKYKSSFDLAKRYTGVGYQNDNCSPLDLYTRLFRKVSESFQSVRLADEAKIIANLSEIYDAAILTYSMKQNGSNSEFNGFIRGVLLTNILDENFTIGYDNDEEYDSVTQTKSQIDDNVDGSRTITAKIGSKKLNTTTLTLGKDIYNSVFSSADRTNNFPLESRKYTADLLFNMDQNSEAGGEWSYPLRYDFSRNSKNSPKCLEPSSLNYVKNGTDSAIAEELVKSLQNFSRDNTGKTIANAISDFYDELILTFEQSTGKKFEDISVDGKFLINGKTCTKRAIVDIITECFGNIVSYFFTPGFVVDGDAYVTLAYNYKNLIDYSLSLSQIQGVLTDSITTAYKNNFLYYENDSTTSTLSYLSPVINALNILYEDYQRVKVSVSAIAGIADIVDSACEKFLSTIDLCSKDLSTAPDSKFDCLKSLTPEVASGISLRKSFDYGVRDCLSESLTIYDVSATKWFYKSNKLDFDSLKSCVVVGFPCGFTSQLSKKQIRVEKGVAIDSLPERRDITKTSINVSSRSISRPYDSVSPITIAYFHPYVNAYVSSVIPEDVQLNSLVENQNIKLMCYDKLAGVWIDTTKEECVNFLINGGSFGVSSYGELSQPLTEGEATKIILIHAMDAILKSTIRVATGINFSAVSSKQKTIGTKAAAALITLLTKSPLIPRGAMSASQFLQQNTDGTYSAIPYSGLSGNASNLTTPADHSLLLKILNSGVFVSETSHERLLTPDPFERTYCAIYDAGSLTYSSKVLINRSSIDLASLFSINVEAN